MPLFAYKGGIRNNVNSNIYFGGKECNKDRMPKL